MCALMNPAPPAAPLGQSNAVLHAIARRHAWSGVGPLSIKTFSGGTARYTTGAGGQYAVDDRSYLLLNQGQPYAIDIESDTPVESFCVFFAPGFAAGVLHSLRGGARLLLDTPAPSFGAPVEFFDRTYAHGDLLSPALLRLRQAQQCLYEQSWLDEQFHDLMARLLWVHQHAAREIERLQAARPATRAELYRRLHRARDYIDAAYSAPLTLEDIARVAGLSPNHLLRTFRQLFQQTPYQYVTARRLEQASRLLRETDRPVTEICLAVGFESLGSFSWLFRRRVGIAPLGYRRQHQRI